MAKRGRPAKDDENRRSITLGVRVTPELHQRLTAAATDPERPVTVSQEIERRLRESFDLEQKIEARFGGKKNYDLAQAIATGITHNIEPICNASVAPEDRKTWWQNPFIFSEGVAFINALLKAQRPKGKRSLPPLLAARWLKPGSLGEHVARAWLDNLQLAALGSDPYLGGPIVGEADTHEHQRAAHRRTVITNAALRMAPRISLPRNKLRSKE